MSAARPNAFPEDELHRIITEVRDFGLSPPSGVSIITCKSCRQDIVSGKDRVSDVPRASRGDLRFDPLHKDGSYGKRLHERSGD